MSNPVKRKESERIRRETEEFMSKGGRVRYVPNPEPPAVKRPYNPYFIRGLGWD